ncbi:phosphatase PAP2 family protein [Brachybacterium sp. DNPG3]
MTSPAPGASRSYAGRETVVRLAALLAVLVAAMLVGLLVAPLPAVRAADDALVRAANDALGPFTTLLAVGIAEVFSGPLALGLAALAAVGCGLLRRSRRAGVRTALLIAVPWGCSELLKLAVQRLRPDLADLAHPLLVQPASFSFPSGHTAFAAALCCGIMLSLTGPTPTPPTPTAPAPRTPTAPSAFLPRSAVAIGAAASVLVVVATAWSRVALGMHHPTDVLVAAVLVPVLALILARLTAPLVAPPTASPTALPTAPRAAPPAHPAGPVPARPRRTLP